IKSADAAEFLKRIAPDAVIIIAYGQIIPSGLLEIPRLGWINLHGSLLPRYRGAAPVQRAILNGDTRTGLTTMQIDAGLDTGPILEQLEVEIAAAETAPELMVHLGDAGAALMVDTLRKFDSGEIKPRAQDNAQATFAPPLKKEEGLIDWNRPAHEIYNRMRAFRPWPGTYTQFRGRMLHLWGGPEESPTGLEAHEPGSITDTRGEMRVACGEGTWLRVEYIQPEGRKRMGAREFANGARILPSERFNS
ncbi:MAG: methionyl-tRNA formyltransferase, partial [Candidatus Acidiferrales bacterium]